MYKMCHLERRNYERVDLSVNCQGGLVLAKFKDLLQVGSLKGTHGNTHTLTADGIRRRAMLCRDLVQKKGDNLFQFLLKRLV